MSFVNRNLIDKIAIGWNSITGYKICPEDLDIAIYLTFVHFDGECCARALTSSMFILNALCSETKQHKAFQKTYQIISVPNWTEDFQTEW